MRSLSERLMDALESLRSMAARWLVLLTLDAVVAAACLRLALLLRFEGKVPRDQVDSYALTVLLLVAVRVVANVLVGIHHWSFRLSGLVDGARVWLATLLGTGLFVLGLFLARVQAAPPRSVVMLEFVFSGIGMILLRFSPRLAQTYVGVQTRAWGKEVRHTLILGAGSAGDLLLRDLQRSQEHAFSVVGFLDDDPAKHGMYVSGVRVLGPIDDLAGVARRHHVEEVLIAVPRLEARRIREILAMCADLKLHFKILPVSFVYLNERVSASMLQELSPDDLLPREPVSFSDSGESPKSSGRVVLVTGAAGSIGSEISRQLLQGGVSRLVMVDMNENGLYLNQRAFEREFAGAEVLAEVADIRDPGRLRALFGLHRPQDVFHAAAHKHVPLLECCPGEAVKNNILGTKNVAEAADEFGAERFVYISTDKAVRPTSVMGASKRVGEKIVRSLATRSATRYCAVRFGNVLGSSGSVVPLFRQQIAAGGPVTVTDPEVRRYFMTISEAVGLVLRAAYGDYGELCVLDMGEQIRILDLARHMITMVGQVPDLDVPIVFTGLRPGEKLFEELLTEEEEKTSQVAAKILVASSPTVRDDLEARISELAEAAHAEDQRRVRELLQQLVPSYFPPVPAATDPEAGADSEAEAGRPLPVM